MILGLLMVWIVLDGQPILIESEESKTAEMTSVFNQITWQWRPDKEIWMMNQSYSGSQPAPSKWERLALVIDKTKSPPQARFYQLKSGNLLWEEQLINQRENYRASCFICHNNGPRAIRPVFDSTTAPLGWRERIKIQVWNLRIKTYGRVVYSSLHDEEAPHLAVPFANPGREANETLNVATCNNCHTESGLFARGPLRRQQVGTISFLLKAGHMPPAGFTLSKKEKKQLQDFIRGF